MVDQWVVDTERGLLVNIADDCTLTLEEACAELNSMNQVLSIERGLADNLYEAVASMARSVMDPTSSHWDRFLTSRAENAIKAYRTTRETQALSIADALVRTIRPPMTNASALLRPVCGRCGGEQETKR